MLKALPLILVFASTSAWAGQWLSQCQSVSKTSSDFCNKAVATEQKAEADMVAAGSVQSGKINKNAGIEQTTTTATDQNLATAIKDCQQALSKCQNVCRDQQGAAARAGSPDGRADAAAIPGVQQSQCTDPIQKNIDQLGAGKAPMKQDSQDSGKTGDSSGLGQLGQLAGMGGQGQGDNSATPSSTSSTDTASTPGAPDNGKADFTSSAAKAAGGSGDGSATRDGDPNSNSQSASSGSLSSGSASPMSTGGGLGSSTAAAGAPVAANVGGNGAGGSSLSPGGGMGADGGGGGGGYGGGSNNDSGAGEIYSKNPRFGAGKEKPVLPAGPVAGSAYNDRSGPHGPSVFYIQDAAINSFCIQKSIKKACIK
jgi:hypothetical protein